ncbi:hypothetical protein M2R29_21460, partial [Aeromonas hydrophila]|uniref:hypothetical protein n=1 Tax=Aeromonas hydrophila TaxID=644 RepID=UPI00207D6087
IDAGNGNLYIHARTVSNIKAVFTTTFNEKPSNQITPPVYVWLPTSALNQNEINITPIKGGESYQFSTIKMAKEYSVTLGAASSEVVADSASAIMLSGGNMSINADFFSNISSYVNSGGDISFAVSQIENKGYQFGSNAEVAIYKATGEQKCLIYNGGQCAGPVLYIQLKLEKIDNAVTHGSASPAIISSNGNLTGTVAGMIDNVTIKAHAGPVSTTTQRPSLSLPQAQGSGAAPDLQGDAQYLAQQLKPVGPDNGVPLPDFQLPSGDKGLFTVNGKSDSPYLIEVNPLLANLGQAGSGMLDRIDAALQQQLQGAGQLSFDGVSGNGGIAQVAGQHADWALPGRASSGGNSPELQSLSGMALSNSGHVATLGQWQQSLQP